MLEESQKRELKQYFDGLYANKYQQYIQFIQKSNDKNIDATEYKNFLEQNIKRDITPLQHAYLNRVIDFQQFWGIMTSLVGFDLIVQQYIKPNV